MICLFNWQGAKYYLPPCLFYGGHTEVSDNTLDSTEGIPTKRSDNSLTNSAGILKKKDLYVYDA